MIRTIAISILLALAASAEDWPTYAHDNRRSHTTGESLTLPLKPAWTYESPNLPQTAWTGPAKWDAYAGNDGLQSMRNFDPAYFVTAVGDKVYFGSSADNAAHCLEASTGEELWVAFTDSAVRLPPTIADGRAHFGSDDGFAVGMADGVVDGLTDGLGVGDGVGSLETVGAADMVGSLVGAKLTDGTKEIDGLDDGASDGSSEGSF